MDELQDRITALAGNPVKTPEQYMSLANCYYQMSQQDPEQQQANLVKCLSALRTVINSYPELDDNDSIVVGDFEITKARLYEFAELVGQQLVATKAVTNEIKTNADTAQVYGL